MRIAAALLASVAVSALAGPAFAQFGSRTPTLTLYGERGLSGEQRQVWQATSNFQTIRFNDRARSLVAEGRWEVCIDALYNNCRIVEGRIDDLGGLADMISSARPIDGASGGGWGGGGGWGSGSGDVILFSGPNFTGESRTLTAEVSDFRSIGFNDRTGSIRIRPGTSWTFCSDAAFASRCETLTGDQSDLFRFGLSSNISSARPTSGWGSGGGGWGGGGWGGAPSATGRTANFYANPNVSASQYGGGRQGAQRAADEFCRSQGFRGSPYFSVSGNLLEDVVCAR